MNEFNENLTEALEFTAAFTPEAFPTLCQHLDPRWIDEALLTTGVATMRRRRLPADRAVWLVLGMAVLRDWSITAVADQLELALPARTGSRTVAPSALIQARARLGADPMEVLFARAGEERGHASADRANVLKGACGTCTSGRSSAEDSRDQVVAVHPGPPPHGDQASGSINLSVT